VILVNQKRVGFGKFFSWLPLNAEVLEIILVNPRSFLSVELLGLLARLQRENENTPVIKFTLATLQ
jgi:hypothetical protein